MKKLAETIKGLEQYRDAGWTGINDYYRPFVIDAMELLKAQEPMKPGLGKINHDDGSVSYFLHCPFDGVTLVDGDNYCRRCGRAVKWNG